MTEETKKPDREAVARLEEMMTLFNETTAKLEASHAALQDKVKALQAELAEKNRLLARRSRLAALGEIAAGVAHEIRNPLGGIGLYADMLAAKLDDQSAIEVVAKIQRGVRTLNDLVEKLLIYTSGVSADFEETDIAVIIEDALAYAAAEIDAADVRVQGPEGSGGFPLVADSYILVRAFLNVILNAVQAMGEGGTLRISVESHGESESGYYAVSFRDSGPGIPEQDIERIFDPFFTKKSTGTGLGLAITAGCVEAHRGKIEAHNAGDGAEFVFTLPKRPDLMKSEGD
jgi:signal transduction histidine kinase